jgi:hypothetical protein
METALIKTEHQPDVEKVSGKSQKDHIKSYLQSYIEQNINCDGPADLDGQKCPDHQTRLRYMTMDFIVKNFSLEELWLFFFPNRMCSYFNRYNIKESKRNAIDYINANDYLTPQDVKRLKKKVWDMNPILFGLSMELINLSDFFWDEEEEDYDVNKAIAMLWEPAIWE